LLDRYIFGKHFEDLGAYCFEAILTGSLLLRFSLIDKRIFGGLYVSSFDFIIKLLQELIVDKFYFLGLIIQIDVFA